MTGNQLKIEIKKLDITQEKAAEMLGITRATFNNWCKQAELHPSVVKNINTIFGLASTAGSESDLQETVKSQQRTIETQSETINRQSKIIESLTIK